MISGLPVLYHLRDKLPLSLPSHFAEAVEESRTQMVDEAEEAELGVRRMTLSPGT